MKIRIQLFECIYKGTPLHLHYKVDYCPAFAAPETMPRILVKVHFQRRGTVATVEWAVQESGPIRLQVIQCKYVSKLYRGFTLCARFSIMLKHLFCVIIQDFIDDPAAFIRFAEDKLQIVAD